MTEKEKMKDAMDGYSVYTTLAYLCFCLQKKTSQSYLFLIYVNDVGIVVTAKVYEGLSCFHL
jgi:hypothetical protein